MRQLLGGAPETASATGQNRCAEALGEAVRALPRKLTDRHPDFDRRGLAGLRQELLWPIVREEVPRLLATVEAELNGSG